MPAEAKAQAARFIPLGRIGSPEDVAGAVLMLASDEGPMSPAPIYRWAAATS